LDQEKTQEQNLILHPGSVAGMQMPRRMFFTHLTFMQQQRSPIQIAYLPIYSENMPWKLPLTGIRKVLRMGSKVNVLEVLILKETESRIFVFFRGEDAEPLFQACFGIVWSSLLTGLCYL